MFTMSRYALIERLRDLMACPVLVDLRNVCRPGDSNRLGFALCKRKKALDRIDVSGAAATQPADFGQNK